MSPGDTKKTPKEVAEKIKKNAGLIQTEADGLATSLSASDAVKVMKKAAQIILDASGLVSD